MVELLLGWSTIHGVTPSIYDLYADMHGASAGHDYDDMGQTRYFWTWNGQRYEKMCRHHNISVMRPCRETLEGHPTRTRLSH